MGRVNGQQKIAVSRLERKSIVADLNHEIQDELAAEGKRLDSDDCVNRLFLSVVFIPFYQNALKSGRILDAVKIRNVILRLPNDKIASAIEANSNLTGRARMLGITRTLNIPVSESN